MPRIRFSLESILWAVEWETLVTRDFFRRERELELRQRALER